MSEWYTFDANVPFYASDPRDPNKQAIAQDLLLLARVNRWKVPLQIVGEYFHAITRRSVLTRVDALAAAERMLTNYETVAPSQSSVAMALKQAAAQTLSYWDALMLATAAEAGCIVCFSEDMQDGYRFGAIEVVNPFGPDGLSARAVKLLSPQQS